MKLKPPFKITPYHANIITDQRFDLDWFKQFDIVMNALDNLGMLFLRVYCILTYNIEARRHVNRMCLATGKPLIESGTAGLLGQATVHVKASNYNCIIMLYNVITGRNRVL